MRLIDADDREIALDALDKIVGMVSIDGMPVASASYVYKNMMLTMTAVKVEEDSDGVD